MKKKGQAVEADIASSIDTKVLMASYIEDNTSHGKGCIFESGSTVHVCSQKELFNNSLVAKEEEIVNGEWLRLRSHWHWDNQAYRKRWDGECSGG